MRCCPKIFVNSIEEAADSFDYEPHNEGLTDSIRTMLSKQPMYCESGTLALTQRTKNGVLVTDDQFLYALSNIDGICTVGIIGFLINVTQNWESLLNISKKLHRLNYANYLPLPLYKRIVDLLLEEDGEVKQGSNEIINWIRSDTDNEPTEHHEDVVLTLARDVYLSQQPYLSPENLLGGISLTILERRNPGLVQELVANAFKATLNEAAGVEYDK